MKRCRKWPVCLALVVVLCSAINGSDLPGKKAPALQAMAQLETLNTDANNTTSVFYDYVEDGILKGGRSVIQVPKSNLKTLTAMPPYNAYTLIDNGPSDNRIDLVFVGDGYTADEMDIYHRDVLNVIASFFDEPPLDTYANYFNVHVVEVISNESGVDEPDYGIYRDTALDMAFNCNGIPRLLCVDYGKAWAAASNARAVDLVLAIANTSRYGGAGYSKLSTLAGGNSSAVEVALHEYGHSFAGLHDEYDYGDGATYHGSEPTNPNVSIYNASAQLAQYRKWYRWLDLPEVDAFEGAAYCQYGIYRPTENSKMRSLGYPFGPVNIEQFVFSIYSYLSPIDAVSPVSSDILQSSTVFSVTTQNPVNHTLNIEWLIDAAPIPGANGVNFCPDAYMASNTVQTLTARVSDETALVRDENKRETLLTDQHNWLVWKASADFTGDRIVNIDDLYEMAQRWLLTISVYDVAPTGGDGVVNFRDFAAMAKQLQSGDMTAWHEMFLSWLADERFDIAPPGRDGIVNFLDFAVLATQWQGQ